MDVEADELRRLGAGRTVLELGAWKGRSTVVLAGVARYVVSIDRHQGISGHDNDSLPDYLLNVRSLPNVAMVVADFEAVVPLLGHFDLVYVDGDHDANSVERDVRLAYDYSSPTVICGHDWDFDEVREGFARVLGDRQPGNLVGSIVSFEL
jgi:predicted O-methyltransferase YrrM